MELTRPAYKNAYHLEAGRLDDLLLLGLCGLDWGSREWEERLCVKERD